MRSFDHLTSGLVLGYVLGEEVANAGSEAPDSEAPEMNANAVVWCAGVLSGPHRIPTGCAAEVRRDRVSL